jgi:DNA polymerase-3 subunit alpha
MDNFAHLHVHSEYSFLDGYSRVWDTASKTPGDLIKRLKELDQKYCSITDHGSTAGWVRFDKAMKKSDLIPIFGVEGYYTEDRKVRGLSEELKLNVTRGLDTVAAKKKAIRNYEKRNGLSKRAHFIALALNEDGIYEILKTLSIASTEGFYYRPRHDFELIKEMKNCIFTSACAGGILNCYLAPLVDDAKKMKTIIPDSVFNRAYESALIEAKKWKDTLGDRFYIEIQSLDWADIAHYNMMDYRIAKELNIPMVLTTDSHYSYPQDYEAHDILLALQSTHYENISKDVLNDPNRMRYEMKDLFIKSRKEMFSYFYRRNKLEHYPKAVITEAMNNTLVIAERCHHGINKKKMIMPNLAIPSYQSTNKFPNDEKKDYFWYLIKVGWAKKIAPYVKKENIPEYMERIKYEFEEITRQGFTPYFILVYDLMKWVDKQGIARGPARGSSAGSLIAYLLNITMIDPIPHKLLFSRFIDPNRTDFPDIDMDFEDYRRREIVQYFIETFGVDSTAVLGTNMVFKPKMALKDVGRLYGVPLNEIQELCNLVVQRSGADSRLSFCLHDTFDQFEYAKVFQTKYPNVARFSADLESKTCRQGVHAAGVVIADGDIRKYTSLRYDKRQKDFLVTTIDKHDAEDIGLLKMDILGLNTMTILNEAKKLVKLNHNADIDLESIVRDVTYNGGDADVYKEFANGNTIGIFQFQSPGLTRLAVNTKIDKFSEIADAVSLHRPGPIHCLGLGQKILRYNYTDGGEFGPEPCEEWVEIGAMVGQKWGVITYDHNKDMCCVKEGLIHSTGKRKVYKVKTKSGKELVCTEDERFMVDIGKYKKLKDIALGEKIYYI